MSLCAVCAPAQVPTGPAPAATPAATAITQRTSYAMQLFRETCGANFADPPLTAEVAKKYGFPFSPAYGAELLYGQPGKAWDASAGGSGAVALVLIESGGWTCQVHVRHIDPDFLQRRFRNMMENLSSPGMKMEKYDQRKSTQDGVTLEQAGYFLYQDGKEEGWSFVLTTSTPNAPGWHATFTVAGAKRGR
jgi:hypothetical protein